MKKPPRARKPKPPDTPLDYEAKHVELLEAAALLFAVFTAALAVAVVHAVRREVDLEPRHPLAHAVGVGAPIITSFIGHKYLTFRKRQHV